MTRLIMATRHAYIPYQVHHNTFWNLPRPRFIYDTIVVTSRLARVGWGQVVSCLVHELDTLSPSK